MAVAEGDGEVAARRRSRRQRAAAFEFAGASLLLLGAALLNRFPWLFNDDISYLREGAPDYAKEGLRSVVFSKWAYLTTEGASVWILILVDALLVVALLRPVMARLAPEGSSVTFLGMVAGLTVLSSVSWEVSLVLADVFRAVGILCLYLLCFEVSPTPPLARLALSGLLFASIVVHPGHGPICALVLVAIFGLRFLHDSRACYSPRGFRVALATVCVAAGGPYLLSGAGLATGKYYTGARWQLMLSRMVRDGLIYPLLNERCPPVAAPRSDVDAPYKLCPYREQLREFETEEVSRYLWKRSSPFHALGGWSQDPADARKLVLDDWRAFPLRNLWATLRGSLVQLLWADTTAELIPLPELTLHRLTKELGPLDGEWFSRSRQYLQADNLGLKWFGRVHDWVYRIALGLLILFSLNAWRRPTQASSRSSSPMLATFVYVTLAGLVSNAAVCAFFVGPAPRYQASLSWLAVLCVGLLLRPWVLRRRWPALSL